MQAPWKPQIDNGEDTSHFDFDDEQLPRQLEEEPDLDDDTNGNEFYGFTFKRHLIDGGQPPAFFQGAAASSASNNASVPSSSSSSTSNAANNPDPVYV